MEMVNHWMQIFLLKEPWKEHLQGKKIDIVMREYLLDNLEIKAIVYCNSCYDDSV